MNSKIILKPETSSIIKKSKFNPLLTSEAVPYECQLLFNAGVTKYQGKYIMVFRNDYNHSKGNVSTNLGIAYSLDGIKWDIAKKPLMDESITKDEDVSRIYDPRLTVLEGKVYMCFAVDTNHGVRGGVAVTEDFESFEILDISVPDNRNMVMFPERIGGMYIRLERPFPVYSRGGDRFDIWMSDSFDARYWGNSKLVLGVEDVPFANDKIGPGAPPVKTEKGWLTTFHAVDRDRKRGKNGWEDKWQKRYTIGIMLLDLEDPSKVIGMSKLPLIAPDKPYETQGGFRNDVVFPGGMILEDNGEVKIYYGAADTCECLATADVFDLISLCCEKRHD